jgi:ATP-dependent Zn protease
MGRHVWFRTPTKDDRKDVFDLYLGKVAHDLELDTPRRRDEIARITSGYSPAMIDQVCSMALTNAQHEGRESFGWGHLVQAMTTLESGTAINVQYVEHQARAIAVHEAGHAAAAHIFRPNVESSRLSIRMRGESLGHHQSFEREERFHHAWRSEDFGDLIHTLGAMAAEKVFYDETSNGVGGDLGMATSKVALMVGQWGMGPQWIDATTLQGPNETEEEAQERLRKRFERIGLALMNRTRGSADFHGDPIASVLGDPHKRSQAAQLLGQAFVTAYNFVRVNKQAIETIAGRVLEKNELFGDELIELLESQHLTKPELDYSKEETWPRM